MLDVLCAAELRAAVEATAATTAATETPKSRKKKRKKHKSKRAQILSAQLVHVQTVLHRAGLEPATRKNIDNDDANMAQSDTQQAPTSMPKVGGAKDTIHPVSDS